MKLNGNTSGLVTMSPAMSRAERYHQWLLKKAEPFLGNRVLEIGVGYGDYTKRLRNKELVVGIDIAEDCVSHCVQLFKNVPHVICLRFDIENDSPTALTHHGLDSAICFNVLEHVEHDVHFLKRVHEIMAPQSQLILIVPAIPRLYGALDALAGHWRRYTQSMLEERVQQAGWQVVHATYFNSLSGLGWFFTNHVVRPKSLGDKKVGRFIMLFDRFGIPLSRFLDIFLHRWFGQSLLLVARRD